MSGNVNTVQAHKDGSMHRRLTGHVVIGCKLLADMLVPVADMLVPIVSVHHNQYTQTDQPQSGEAVYTK